MTVAPTLLFALNRESFTDVVMTFPLINDKDEFATDWPKARIVS